MARSFSISTPIGSYHAQFFRMTDVPNDAPDLLHKNPEINRNDITSLFIDLYQRARRRFSHEILKSSATDSAWNAALRPKWTPANYNTVAYDDRLSKLVSRSWEEVRPAIQRMDLFIEADPTLLDIHAGLAHTFDVREGRAMPERIALFNLRMWVTQGLRRFWDHRLTGEMVALFGVQTGSVELKGLVPEPMLSAHLSPSHDPSDKHTAFHADRPRNPTPSSS